MAEAPQFALFATELTYWLLLVVVAATELFALLNCALQKPEAFAAVGGFSKGAWLAITAAALLFTLLFGWTGGGLFGLFLATIGVAAALVYLLDTRPALRDAVDGSGPW